MTSSRSPVDAYGLHTGPVLHAIPDDLDPALLRHALPSSHHLRHALHSLRTSSLAVVHAVRARSAPAPAATHGLGAAR